jgi:Holliday junction resolvasome RuvABC endonuclease subunit
MKIPVVGFDPSLTHWGIAEAQLDLTTGFLEELKLTLVEPDRIKSKQVRQNSMDLHEAEQLAARAITAARAAKAVFVEVPVGSQSARAMASYGVCVGILGTLRAEGIQLIEVNPTEVKLGFTGSKNATKKDMIARAVTLYPQANFPQQRGRITDKAEHVADAIAVIHAGVNTPLFQSLMKLYS